MPRKTTKATTKKKTNTGAADTSAKEARAVKPQRSVTGDVIGISLIALGVLALLSVFTASVGVVGEFIAAVLFGMTGVAAYAMPLLLAAVGLLVLMSWKLRINAGKLAASIVLAVAILVVIHSTTGDAVLAEGGFAKYALDSFALGSLERAGGGMLGGVLAFPISYLFGSLGTGLVMGAVALCAIVVLTRLSLPDMGRRAAKHIGETASGFMERRRTLQVERERAEAPLSAAVHAANADRKHDFYNEVLTPPHPVKPEKSKRGKIARDAKILEMPRPAEQEAASEFITSDLPLYEEDGHYPYPGLRDKPARNSGGYRAGMEGAEVDDAPASRADTDETAANNPFAEAVDRHSAPSYGDIGDTQEIIVPQDTAPHAATPIFDVPEDAPWKARPVAQNAPWDAPASNGGVQPVAPGGVPAYTPPIADPWNAERGAVAASAPANVPAGEKTEAPPSGAAQAPSLWDAQHNAPTAPPPEEPEMPDLGGGLEPLMPILSVEEELPALKDGHYRIPPLNILSLQPEKKGGRNPQIEMNEKSRILEETFQSFGISVKVIGVTRGPAITRFELQPAPGVKVSRITGLADDIAMNLAAMGVRIEAPIPGKAAVGIEVPNGDVAIVGLREMLESDEFNNAASKVSVALGRDIAGKAVVADIMRMPHMLIAGQTGAGKSACINALISSILYKATPEEVKLILIDPKMVELNMYNGIPHLLIPVVTDPKKASGALGWAVQEMTERYKRFSETGSRDLKGYNQKMEAQGEPKLPQIVIIIDELADLMLVAPGEVEDRICRIAQLARACGMHLIIATQRPSVNVITGIIKANIPSRIAFAVASQVDSRTILDMAGAEKLLGRGDMLFYPSGASKPTRVQGAYIGDSDVERLVDFIKSGAEEPDYDPTLLDHMDKQAEGGKDEASSPDSDDDELLPQAVLAALDAGQVSVSMLQRKFQVGYARAGRLIDAMEKRGFVTGYNGSKPRDVLIAREEYERQFGGGVGL